MMVIFLIKILLPPFTLIKYVSPLPSPVTPPLPSPPLPSPPLPSPPLSSPPPPLPSPPDRRGGVP